mgnify:FL=1
MNTRASHLERDLLFLFISIVVTVAFQYYGVFTWIFFLLQNFSSISTFVAGFFFTSLFTLTPAAAALAELSDFLPLLPFALIGATGAILGDILLFLFVRDVVSDDIARLINRSWQRWLTRVFHHPFLQWLVPVVGALIIASPLPDELGLMLMGLSRTKMWIMIPVSFAMNFLGIALIWLAVHAL